MSIYSLDWWKGVITYGTSGDQVCDIIASWEVDHASLESQLATRNALVERLVEAGEVIAERLSVRGANESELGDWNIVMDEYKAMKGGEE